MGSFRDEGVVLVLGPDDVEDDAPLRLGDNGGFWVERTLAEAITSDCREPDDRATGFWGGDGPCGT